jgi:Protein of unknown function (DUF1173)
VQGLNLRPLPDQAFVLDEPLYRRLGRRFESELSLWGASDDIHMMMIATFSVAAAGIPTIVELSLMPVTRQWLPVEDGFEKQLVERLVTDGRSFVKGLRYNLGVGSTLASATLTDSVGQESLLFAVRPEVRVAASVTESGGENRQRNAPDWIWLPFAEPMPPFPASRSTAMPCQVSAATSASTS